MRRMRKPLLALVLLISLAMVTNIIAEVIYYNEFTAGDAVTYNYTCTASDGRDPATSHVDARNLTGSISASVLVTHNGVDDCWIFLRSATYEYRNWGNLLWNTQSDNNNTIAHHVDDGSNGICIFKTVVYPD